MPRMSYSRKICGLTATGPPAPEAPTPSALIGNSSSYRVVGNQWSVVSDLNIGITPGHPDYRLRYSTISTSYTPPAAPSPLITDLQSPHATRNTQHATRCALDETE